MPKGLVLSFIVTLADESLRNMYSNDLTVINYFYSFDPLLIRMDLAPIPVP